jgi:hypothetical protein
MNRPTDAASIIAEQAAMAKTATTAALLSLQAEWEDCARRAKGSLDAIRDELRSRTAKDLDAALDVAKKQGGTIHFLFGNMELTAEIGKKVEWDSAKLLPVAGAMKWEAAQQIFKFEVSVPEAIWKALPATMSVTEELAEQFKQIAAARTVKYDKPKITARA